jgi:hypothetical protein
MTTLREHLAEIEEEPPLAEDVDLGRVGTYRGYTELVRSWAALAASGVREECIGHSVAGNPLFALELGDRGADRISVLLAGIHAMEWIGVEVALTLCKVLSVKPPVRRRVLCFPVVNVDGYRQAEDDLRSGRRRFLRANRHGVDLNRNWPTHHRSFHLPGLVFPWLGSSGPEPRSEPEVDAVCQRLDHEVASGATIDLALSLHSFGRMILFPYGGRWRPPDTVDAHRSMAAKMRERIPVRYRPVQSSHWVPGAFAHGMELDHLHAHYGATALLVECSAGGARLADATSWLHPWRWFNPRDPDRECERVGPALEAFLRGELT